MVTTGNLYHLTEKEKQVLGGITRFPDSNDIELSELLRIKRSTITVIRNILKNEITNSIGFSHFFNNYNNTRKIS